MRAAPKPSSEQAAERAVQAYFQTKLMDPTEPLYRFPLPPTLSAVGMLKTRQVGWMICGEINSKNRMGGYAGFERFFAYFSPRVPDTVVDALIDEDDIRGAWYLTGAGMPTKHQLRWRRACQQPRSRSPVNK
jgi:hypothetical protein